MKRPTYKPMLLLLPLCVALTTFANVQPDKQPPKLCDQKTNATLLEDANENCFNSINSYFDDLIATKKQALIETKFDYELFEKNDFTANNQQPLNSRGRNHLTGLTPNTFSEICKLNDKAWDKHIHQIADYLGYSGNQRKDYITSISSMLLRGNIC